MNSRNSGRRRKIKSSASLNGRLRLSVFKSNINIYAQIIDDASGKTLVSASSIKMDKSQNGIALATVVGKELAEKAKAANTSRVWFDRGSNKFTGRVKALADAARQSGLEF